MKSTIKLLFVVVLFVSTVVAEGDMGNGGRTCPTGTTTCLTENPTFDTKTETTESGSEDSILIFVKEYLGSVLEYFEN